MTFLQINARSFVRKGLPNAWRGWSRQILKQAVSALRIRRSFALGVILLGRYKMRRLNKSYRGQEKTANILSFPLGQMPFDGQRSQGKDLGDIFICWPVVLSEAKHMKISPREHFRHLLVHGFLHLLGYDHDRRSAALKMEKLERKICFPCGN